MDIIKLQEGLLNWFWVTPLEAKKLPAIENICNKLYQQYFPERLKYAKYDLFYPLLKYGLIEFYGDNTYALSPSSAVFNDDFAAFINVPDEMLNEIEQSHCKSEFGIKTFRMSSQILSFINEKGIPSKRYNLLLILKQIPAIDTIIHSWKDDVVGDISNYSWLGNSEPAKGIYKKTQESYSQRGVKVSEKKWKKIPSRSDNIDAYNLAVVWKQIQNNENIGIEFQISYKTITIKNFFFPIVIERLLFFNSLLQPSGVEVFNRKYKASKRECETLNKLFGNKIEMR